MIAAVTFFKGLVSGALQHWKLTLGIFAIAAVLTLTIRFEDAIRSSVVQECNSAQLQTELDALKVQFDNEQTLSKGYLEELAQAANQSVEREAFAGEIARLLDNDPENDGDLSPTSMAFARALNNRARELAEQTGE